MVILATRPLCFEIPEKLGTVGQLTRFHVMSCGGRRGPGLLPVDSHPELLWQGDQPLVTRYQMADATFAPWPTLPITMTTWAENETVQATHGPFAAVPEFNDSVSYFDPGWEPYTWSINSVITPSYGL